MKMYTGWAAFWIVFLCFILPSWMIGWITGFITGCDMTLAYAYRRNENAELSRHDS